MKKIYAILAIGLLAFAPSRLFNNTPQTLPFSQNWATTTLITAADDWSGVPGIIGYRGDDITVSTGVDPQTLLGEGTITVDVIQNLNNPNTNTSGGVGEFDGITDPTIALQGSGTADAPNIIIHLTTTGLQNINVAYNLRDIDGSTDNATQAVALQYRVGNTGNFTNVPAGFVADASSGPSLATLVTPVSAVLPAACNNQAEVQVRVITSNAVGNDEWIGIDDINITGSPLVGGNSTNSNIIANGSFSAPSNINYLTYNAADITDANSIEVAQFTIQDGGGAADGDAVGTILTNLNFSLTNSANVQRIALYDGTTEVAEVAGGATPSFSGLTLTAADDASKTFSVRVTFNTAVTDNQQFVFTITSATADAAGSGFAAGNAGGAASSSTGDNNRIEVTADRLAYVLNTTSPTGLNVAMSPVSLSANDINANRDLDFVTDIRVTSTGTLTGSPVTATPVAGLVTFSTLTHTVVGTGLTLTAERTGTLDWDVVSNPFDIQVASAASDFFRSAATGDWNVAGTWESSPDNLSWIPATLVPNETSAGIVIRNGHTVNFTTNVTADQLEIQSGGTLLNQSATGNRLTINDGAGNDLVIKGGGVYQVTSTLGYANYQTISTGATVQIETAGVIRLGTGGALAGGGQNGFLVTTGSYIWGDAAIFDWNITGIPGGTGVTYFPDATTTVPILRFSAIPGGNIGGGTALTVNGVLEANANVSFNGASNKIFRNGIRGTGNVTLTTGVGKFVINGAAADLGGAGSIITNANGIDIGATTVVTLSSSKTIDGNVALLADSYVDLGNNDLTVTGTVTGGTATSYIRTNGTGALTLNSVDAVSKTFPVGRGTYNPISIINGSNLNWSARVEDVVNNVIAPFNTDKAINRTWHIAPSSAVVTGPDITFNFDDSDPAQLANPASYVADPLVRNAQFWHYNSVAWLAASGGIAMTPAVGPQAITLAGYTNFSPFAIAKTSGPLPVSFGTVRAAQQGSAIKIDWSNLTEQDVISYSVEHSLNGRDFTGLTAVAATRNDGGKADYSYLHTTPVRGINYYRIRSAETTGAAKVSIIVKVDTRGGKMDIVIYPNPVTDGTVSLQATDLAKGQYSIRVFAANGQQVYTQALTHAGGSVTESLQLPATIKAGIYNLVISSGEMKMVKTFMVR